MRYARRTPPRYLEKGDVVRVEVIAVGAVRSTVA